MTLLWMLLAFMAGALPFSVWLGKVGLRRDIRRVGDGNPGATNVFRAGGAAWGALAVFLDVLKGVVPVGTARVIFGVSGPSLLLIALMAPVGHAFSPFLGGKGGKALAATLGVWIGLTLNETPFVGLLFLVFWFVIQEVDGWSVMFTLALLSIYIVVVRYDPVLLAALAGHTLLLAYTHRHDLRRRPALRPSVRRRLFGRGG